MAHDKVDIVCLNMSLELWRFDRRKLKDLDLRVLSLEMRPKVLKNDFSRQRISRPIDFRRGTGSNFSVLW